MHTPRCPSTRSVNKHGGRRPSSYMCRVGLSPLDRWGPGIRQGACLQAVWFQSSRFGLRFQLNVEHLQADGMTAVLPSARAEEVLAIRVFGCLALVKTVELLEKLYSRTPSSSPETSWHHMSECDAVVAEIWLFMKQICSEAVSERDPSII